MKVIPQYKVISPYNYDRIIKSLCVYTLIGKSVNLIYLFVLIRNIVLNTY